MQRRNKSIRSSSRKTVPLADPLKTTLDINQKYGRCLKELAMLVHNPKKQSEKAYLTQTFNVLKDINKCLEQQKNTYKKCGRYELDRYLKVKELWNAGNLIGRFQQIKNQVQQCEEVISTYKQEQIDEGESQVDEEQELRRQLNSLGTKRAQVQSRIESIQEQLELQQKKGKESTTTLLQEQIKLRELQQAK